MVYYNLPQLGGHRDRACPPTATTFADHGIEIPPHAHGEIRTTCPQCSPLRKKKRDRCLSVNVDDGVWYCHHCEWTGGLGGDHYIHAFRPTEPPKPDEQKRQRLQRVWNASLPADHPEAESLRQYLKHRGLGAILEAMPKVIRLHPGLEYWHEGERLGMFPAMICRVVDADGKPVSLHRTYLTQDGKKASVPEPKKLMAPALPGATRGAAIRLYPATDTLSIAEGVETALAVHIATGLPVWSSISAGGLAALSLPRSIRKVLIMADLDRSGTGELAARELARRLYAEGREVKIVVPPVAIPEGAKGVDWLDVLGDAA